MGDDLPNPKNPYKKRGRGGVSVLLLKVKKHYFMPPLMCKNSKYRSVHNKLFLLGRIWAVVEQDVAYDRAMVVGNMCPVNIK